MKLAAFLGSPRSGGNTDTLAVRVLESAKASSVETEIVALRSLTIKPCNGCERCWGNDRPCIFTDDMTVLYELIARADVLLFATPVWWYGPSTLMKAFLDRFVPFNMPQGRPLIKGKDAVLVTAYEEEGPEAAEPLIRMFELSFRYLGMRFIDRLVVDGTGPKGAVPANSRALERAAEIGRAIARRSGAVHAQAEAREPERAAEDPQ